MGTNIVIGIDGGGTHTRYMAANLDGHVLAYTESGSCSPRNNPDVSSMMQRAIADTIGVAGCEPKDVVALVAGLADVDRDEDGKKAEPYTDVPGLDCPRVLINDVDVAHTGVHQGKPGVVACGGTNWAGVARTEEWKRIHSYSLLFYGVGALSLAWMAISRVIAGMTEQADKAFVEQLLAHFEVGNVKAMIDMFAEKRGYTSEMAMHIRALAPVITNAAAQGVPVARLACDQAIVEAEKAVRLLGSFFSSDTVAYGLMGSVIRSEYIRTGVEKRLLTPTIKRYEYVASPLTATAGAVWMALDKAGVQFTPAVEAALRSHPKSVF